jgi:hypothetical protein
VTAPISKSPLSPLQRAVVAKLRGDATLVGLLASAKGVSPAAAAVVDQVVEGQAFPYIRIGDHLSTPANDLTSYGRRVTVTLHVWTRAQSNGPGQTIADRVIELLDHQERALAVTGHRVVSIRHEFDQALSDPDPQIRHHIVRLRVETAQLT